MSKLLALAFLAASAATASAQGVLFQEDFEDGLAGWTTVGIWNAESSTDTCGSWAAPFPSGTGVAYYGHNSPCDYESAGSVGRLVRDGWVDLPAGAPTITLRFMSSLQTEYCWGGWDMHLVEIHVENGAPVTIPLCTDWPGAFATLGWHERRVDITAFAGSRIRPGFAFDSVDGVGDQHRGWFVDDVSILVEPGVRVCPSTDFHSGCPCASNTPPIPTAGGCLNSTGRSAVLVSSGAPVVSGDTLGLLARAMPPNATCLLAQAAASGTPIHFGDGVRCVSGTVRRMGALTASNGVASWPPAGTDPIALRGGVPAGGGTRYYYVYYRDVQSHCNPATFNITDTQRIVWAP